ncbi:hypothetical protein EK904_007137 [Melospiza melodia maxima]|nr:hypothetical protein EK904_007137 [Melospiza melodia maxima]
METMGPNVENAHLKRKRTQKGLPNASSAFLGGSRAVYTGDSVLILMCHKSNLILCLGQAVGKQNPAVAAFKLYWRKAWLLMQWSEKLLPNSCELVIPEHPRTSQNIPEYSRTPQNIPELAFWHCRCSVLSQVRGAVLSPGTSSAQGTPGGRCVLLNECVCVFMNPHEL